jgi:hypothetical protein
MTPANVTTIATTSSSSSGKLVLHHPRQQGLQQATRDSLVQQATPAVCCRNHSKSVLDTHPPPPLPRVLSACLPLTFAPMSLSAAAIAAARLLCSAMRRCRCGSLISSSLAMRGSMVGPCSMTGPGSSSRSSSSTTWSAKMSLVLLTHKWPGC